MTGTEPLPPPAASTDHEEPRHWVARYRNESHRKTQGYRTLPKNREKKTCALYNIGRFKAALQWIIIINDVNSIASTICCLIIHLFWPNEEYLLNIKKERHRNYFKPFEDERPAEVVLL